jgi:hypothetical protein
VICSYQLKNFANFKNTVITTQTGLYRHASKIQNRREKAKSKYEKTKSDSLYDDIKLLNYVEVKIERLNVDEIIKYSSINTDFVKQEADSDAEIFEHDSTSNDLIDSSRYLI